MPETVEKELTPQVVDGSRQLAIEIKAQRELALSRPRDERNIFEKAIAALKSFPEFAEDAYYSIPYNKTDEDTGERVKEYVEGISVVASREIARLWGNCASANRIVSEDENAVQVEGIFADFETNAFFRAVVRVPRTYIPRGSSIPKAKREDQMNISIQAGLSKAERNAQLKGIPGWFKDRYFAESKKVAGSKGKAEGKSVEERKAALFAQFAKLGVDGATLEAYIMAKFPGDAGSDEMFGTMRGIFNGIKEKHSKVEDVFSPAKPAEKKEPVNLKDIPGANL